MPQTKGNLVFCLCRALCGPYIFHSLEFAAIVGGFTVSPVFLVLFSFLTIPFLVAIIISIALHVSYPRDSECCSGGVSSAYPC